MTNFIPIFPLELVVYPGEHLNLHIFEPRYKQLIQDCLAAKRPFGIPSVIDKKMNDMGTLVEVVEISKVYESGEMDVKTVGTQVFRILEMIRDTPDKLYSGAIVNYPDNIQDGRDEIRVALLEAVRKLHKFLKINKDFKKEEQELSAYDLAHHAGMSIQEEYELLQLMHELQRQEYLKRHIGKVLAVLGEMEALKNKIMLNGHFKNLSQYDF